MRSSMGNRTPGAGKSGCAVERGCNAAEIGAAPNVAGRRGVEPIGVVEAGAGEATEGDTGGIAGDIFRLAEIRLPGSGTPGVATVKKPSRRRAGALLIEKEDCPVLAITFGNHDRAAEEVVAKRCAASGKEVAVVEFLVAKEFIERGVKLVGASAAGLVEDAGTRTAEFGGRIL